MKAVVLAGGRGSRLRPLTDKLPKPMVELCGMPVMEYTVRNLVRGGITDIAVTLCYKPRAITDYFGDGANGVRISPIFTRTSRSAPRAE